MIDVINLTTTATYNEKAEMWIADIKGYPVSGKGETPEEAVIDARDKLQTFFLSMAERRYVSVIHAPVSLKAVITVRIESDRGATLTEFGLGTGCEEQGGSE